MEPPSLTVTLPPEARYLALVRRLLGSFARHLELAETEIADVEAVASEACALVIQADGAPGAPVRLEAGSTPHELTLVVSGASGEALEAVSGEALGPRLIRALTSDFRVRERSGGGAALALRLPLA